MTSSIYFNKLSKIKLLHCVIVALIIITSWGCSNDSTPKPRGFFRIQLPAREYVKVNADSLPFSFEMPNYCSISKPMDSQAQKGWFNLDFKAFKAKVHFSHAYLKNSASLDSMAEDARFLVYKHTVKASSIEEKLVHIKGKPIGGIFYKIGGNAASNMQFFLTDSTKNFVRGALYFQVSPQSDSLAPVVQFIQEDLEHLFETLEWKHK